LADLYRRQLALNPHDPYLVEHARPRVIRNQVLTFDWYRPHLPAEGAVLDWGCNHAPDSCLLRAAFGDRLQLHGCDFVDGDRYRVFHEFAGLAYTQLADNVRLPYGPESFDAVVASGALEHTAMDYESLRELYRVLKPDGRLIISYLPNWLSYHEWYLRVVRKAAFHRRLYGMGETRQLLKRSGFFPIAGAPHTFFWQRALARVRVRRGNRFWANLLSRLVPIHRFCSTLCFVAVKVQSM
jgi:SAM-dependent methyltransferase